MNGTFQGQECVRDRNIVSFQVSLFSTFLSFFCKML